MKYRQPGTGQRLQGREGKGTPGGPRSARSARTPRDGPRGAAGDALLPVRPPGAGARERPDRRPLSQMPRRPPLLPQLRALRPGRPLRVPPGDPEARPVQTAANTCEFFRPESVLDATGRRIATPGPSAPAAKVSPGRAAFEALFKKK